MPGVSDVQAAWAASRSRNSYLRAQFVRLKSRRGPKKAILALAASMLTASYHMLQEGLEYQDLGADHFDRRERASSPNGSSDGWRISAYSASAGGSLTEARCRPRFVSF
jgi:hypothetical protein